MALLSAPPARAQPSADASALARLEQAIASEQERGWFLEQMRLFTAFFWQQGHGLQSQAGQLGERGREDAWILEPMMYFRVRQNAELVHELTVPVDIVSAASTDAIDAVSKASEYNEAATFDLSSTYSPSEIVDMSFRFAFHYEEPMRSFIGGPALTFKLFEENTVIGARATVVSDGFDPHSYTGVDRGFAARTTFSFELDYLQVLSPTTVVDASVTLTEQWGVLETTWNSMLAQRTPTEEDPDIYYRTGEIFPKSRFRSAYFVRLSQHVPATRSTAKGSYRFYFDEDGTLAHTSEIQIFQYLVPWLYVRAHGRHHQQNANDFWAPQINEPFAEKALRTSDSDLEAFIAREAGVRLVLVRDLAPPSFRDSDSFDLQYLRYQRTNDLHVDYGSLGYQRTFQ